MPIFISYSQKDRDFVDSLAGNLVRAKHHIWMDRWELNVGDSLTQKIEESLTDSSAILVVLSKNSIESPWCRRELTAGLVRELEERKTLVLPVIKDDCKIPLFLRDKLYADFRKDPDEAFELIDRSLSKITNPTTSRKESPDFLTDFALDWKPKKHRSSEESWILRWTFVDHGNTFGYVVVSECKVYVEGSAESYEAAVKADRVLHFARDVLAALLEKIGDQRLNGLIEDNMTKTIATDFVGPGQKTYMVTYSYRRIGLDPGMDTVVYLDNNLNMAMDHYRRTLLD
jgi:hypothetical protein